MRLNHLCEGILARLSCAKTDITFDADPKTAWTLGKLNANAPYVYFTMGGSKYLNNHLGGADNFRVAQHNPIGANNKCSLWTLHQYDEAPSSIQRVERATVQEGMFLSGSRIVILHNGMKYSTSGLRLE